MSRKPKPKLPAGWEVYSNANRKTTRRQGPAWWKYAIWVFVLIVLTGIAFFPWHIIDTF